MTVFNGSVLFNGVDTAGNNGLWTTNGTAAGTPELTPITGARTTGGLSKFRLVNQRIGFLQFAVAGDWQGVWHGGKVSGYGER